MRSKVVIKVPRNHRDKGGFPITIGEMVISGEKGYVDLFAMPIKPMRLYLEFTNEPERPSENVEQNDDLELG